MPRDRGNNFFAVIPRSFMISHMAKKMATKIGETRQKLVEKVEKSATTIANGTETLHMTQFFTWRDGVLVWGEGRSTNKREHCLEGGFQSSSHFFLARDGVFF